MVTSTASGDPDHPYFHVRDLVVKLRRHPPGPLSSDDLAAYGIEAVNMDIETGTPADSGQKFCDLYPLSEFNAIFKKVDEWPRLEEIRGYKAALLMRQLIEKSLVDGGLLGKSKYHWRR